MKIYALLFGLIKADIEAFTDVPLGAESIDEVEDFTGKKFELTFNQRSSLDRPGLNRL